MFKIEKVSFTIPGDVSRQPIIYRYEIPLYKHVWKKQVRKMDGKFEITPVPKAFGEQRFGYPISIEDEEMRLENLFGTDDHDVSIFDTVFPGETFRREFELCYDKDGVKDFKPNASDHAQFTNDDPDEAYEVEQIESVSHSLADMFVRDQLDTVVKVANADVDRLMQHGDVSLSMATQIKREAASLCQAAAD